MAIVVFCDVSFLTDTGVPHKFEIFLSLESNKKQCRCKNRNMVKFISLSVARQVWENFNANIAHVQVKRFKPTSPSAATRNHMSKVAEAHTQKLGNALLFLHYSKL